MLRSLYAGISGMRGFQTKLDVIGNNIANVNTIGYKASRVMFSDILSQTISGISRPEEGVRGGVNPRQIGLGSSISSIDVLHTPGSFQTTNVETDLAIDGDGFFAVKASEDQEVPYLTRAGNFTRDAAGQLVTSSGMFVVDEGGAPIIISREDYTSFSIGKDGVILGTTPDGTTEEVATIGLVMVQNPGGLKKIGGSLYEITGNANLDGQFEYTTPDNADTGSGALLAGQLEMSNVDLTAEFTEMIVAQRGFQANSRIITTSDDILQELVNLKR
ncbi:flagellar basal-body rod protein FlgF [Microaerobacter geothermalis]|uniref:flagellar basal body rod protein FlgG n=1 Tax=Microaerobacter geothermalis TaxID=674972 RepID=UPI001F37E160|nr:flagellar basal body rod protein FlgG [Microaerobacter geothermalis]MCF6093831.1 flagellar basal-body rod protein FlgF [Microaerobacter geothermalis]